VNKSKIISDFSTWVKLLEESGLALASKRKVGSGYLDRYRQDGDQINETEQTITYDFILGHL
jgi:hypothetical protein